MSTKVKMMMISVAPLTGAQRGIDVNDVIYIWTCFSVSHPAMLAQEDNSKII